MSGHLIRYVTDLRAAGVPAEQAEVHARALENALHDRIASKADLSELKSEVRADIAGLRAEIGTVATELRAEISMLADRIDARMIRYMVMQAFAILALTAAIVAAIK